jgi:hypothetical protein
VQLRVGRDVDERRGRAHPNAQSARSHVPPTFVFFPENRENNREKLFFPHVISHNSWNIKSLRQNTCSGTGKIAGFGCLSRPSGI